MNTAIDNARIVTHPLCWTALTVGLKYRTIDRTIDASDLVRPAASPNAGTLQAVAAAHPFVPPELTYRIMEEVIAGTFLRRAGPATIESAQCALPPVQVGDTIHAIVEIEEIQPDWAAGQALVAMNVEVVTERGAGVLSYTTVQRVKGGGVQEPSPSRPLRRAIVPSGWLARQLGRTAADRERPHGRLDIL